MNNNAHIFCDVFVSNILLISTSYTLNQFYHRVINMWNSLSQYVVDAEKVNDFKIRIDKHWQGDILFEY